MYCVWIKTWLLFNHLCVCVRWYVLFVKNQRVSAEWKYILVRFGVRERPPRSWVKLPNVDRTATLHSDGNFLIWQQVRILLLIATLDFPLTLDTWQIIDFEDQPFVDCRGWDHSISSLAECQSWLTAWSNNHMKIPEIWSPFYLGPSLHLPFSHTVHVWRKNNRVAGNQSRDNLFWLSTYDWWREMLGWAGRGIFVPWASLRLSHSIILIFISTSFDSFLIFDFDRIERLQSKIKFMRAPSPPSFTFHFRFFSLSNPTQVLL